MLWVFLSILAGFGDATVYAIMKRLKNLDAWLVVWIQFAFSLPIILVLALFIFPETINQNVYWLAFVNAFLLILTVRLLFRAFSSEQLSWKNINSRNNKT